jgi:hypothetical protein
VGPPGPLELAALSSDANSVIIKTACIWRSPAPAPEGGSARGGARTGARKGGCGGEGAPARPRRSPRARHSPSARGGEGLDEGGSGQRCPSRFQLESSCSRQWLSLMIRNTAINTTINGEGGAVIDDDGHP